MIHVVQEYNVERNKEIVQEMFRLRAKVFKHRLNWDVAVEDGLERDKFDDQGPLYIIHTDDHGRVDASCRMMPTSGPTLLAETFADTLPDVALLASPAIWECTRFCVDGDHADETGLDRVVEVSREVMLAIGTLALRSGIETVLGNFDARMYRVYRRMGCRVEILGRTLRHGRAVYLGAFPISAATVANGQRLVAGFKGRIATRRTAPVPVRAPSLATLCADGTP